MLIQSVPTSSHKFQDNFFDKNAMPPEILSILAEENNRYIGIVECDIYQRFKEAKKEYRIYILYLRILR